MYKKGMGNLTLPCMMRARRLDFSVRLLTPFSYAYPFIVDEPIIPTLAAAEHLFE